jgi:hypothetical protein
MLIVAAPGNVFRQSFYPAPSLSLAINVLAQNIIPAMFTGTPVLLSLCVLAFVVGTKYRVPISAIWILMGPIAWAVSLFAAGYFQGTAITVRAWPIPQYAEVVSVLALGYRLGNKPLHHRGLIVAIAVSIIIVADGAALVRLYASMRDYAAVYDSGRLMDVSPDWVKVCAVDFYPQRGAANRTDQIVLEPSTSDLGIDAPSR